MKKMGRRERLLRRTILNYFFELLGQTSHKWWISKFGGIRAGEKGEFDPLVAVHFLIFRGTCNQALAQHKSFLT